MARLTPERLLTLWEAGTNRHPIDRALLLFALADPGTPPERLADAPLGVRNAALMRLRRSRYGDRLEAWVDCEACGERLELDLDAAALPASSGGPAPVTVAGLRFLPVTSRHLAGLVGQVDGPAAAHDLLRACAESPAELPEDAAPREQLLAAVEQALDEADPWADPTLSVRCPACGHENVAPLDVAALLWEELAGEARRLLDEVHTLARAYGWSQAEVLGLSAARRGAYLERVWS